jgi:hypothetical protein
VKRYTLILKSGARIRFRSDGVKLTRSLATNTVTRVSFGDNCNPVMRWVLFDEVAAIVEHRS